MGISDPQPSRFYQITLEQFVTADHPHAEGPALNRTKQIQQLCEPLIVADTEARRARNYSRDACAGR